MAITLATLVLILVSLWRSPSLELLPRLACGLLFTVACFWPGKANIIASGFNCINSLPLGAVLAGLLALDGAQRQSSPGARWRLFAVLVAAGIVATFSFGTGLAVWPAFIILVLLYRLGWRLAAGLGLASMLSATIFLALPSNDGSDVGDGLSQLWSQGPSLLGGFFDVLGAPWVYSGSGWIFPTRMGNGVYLVAGVIGALGALLGVYFFAARFRFRRISEPAETVALGLILFIFGSIALIVIGRGELIAINPRVVLATRYFFWSAFFWAALPVLALYCWPPLRRFPVALCLLALALTAGALPSQLQTGAEYAWSRRAAEDAALRVVCGVEDELSLQQLFKGPSSSVGRIYSLTDIYRERGLDMFAWPGAGLVGKSVTPPSENEAQGRGLLVIGRSTKSYKHSGKMSPLRASPAGA